MGAERRIQAVTGVATTVEEASVNNARKISSEWRIRVLIYTIAEGLASKITLT